MFDPHSLRFASFLWRPEHRWLWKTSGFVLFPWLLVVLFLPTHLLSEDDGNFIAHFSGALGPALPCIPYLSYAANRALVLTYRWAPSFPWYGVLLHITLLWGVMSLVGPLFRRATHVAMLTPLLLLLPLLVYVYALPTFTMSMLLLLFGGYLSLMDRLWNEDSKGLGPLLFPTLAILVACSLRWYLGLHLLVMFPLFFFRRRQQKQLFWIVVALFCFFGTDRLWYAWSASPESVEFARYSRIRSEFHDARTLHKLQATPKALTAAGWSGLDLVAFGKWVLFDESKFNAKNITAYLQHHRLKRFGPLWKRVKLNWRDYFSMNIESFLFLAMVVFCLLGLLFLFKGEFLWSLFWRWISWFSFWCAILLYIMSHRVVPWVFIPLLVYFCCGAGWLTLQVLAGKAGVPSEHSWQKMIGLGFLLFGLLVGFVMFPRSLRTDLVLLPQHAAQSRWYDRTLSELKRQSPQVRWLIPMELHAQQLWRLSPFDTRGGKRLHTYVPAGMFTQSPVYYKLLEQIGLKDGRGLLRWSIGRQGALFIATVKDTTSLHQFWSRYINHLKLSPKTLTFERVRYFQGAGVQISLFRLVAR